MARPDPVRVALFLAACAFLAACVLMDRRRSALVREGETILTGEAVVIEGEHVLERQRIRREGRR